MSAHLGARSLYNDSFVLVESGPDDAATVQFAEQTGVAGEPARLIMQLNNQGVPAESCVTWQGGTTILSQTVCPHRARPTLLAADGDANTLVEVISHPPPQCDGGDTALSPLGCADSSGTCFRVPPVPPHVAAGVTRFVCEDLGGVFASTALYIPAQGMFRAEGQAIFGGPATSRATVRVASQEAEFRVLSNATHAAARLVSGGRLRRGHSAIIPAHSRLYRESLLRIKKP